MSTMSTESHAPISAEMPAKEDNGVQADSSDVEQASPESQATANAAMQTEATDVKYVCTYNACTKRARISGDDQVCALENSTPIVINLQGTIAAGKSTQLAALREHYKHDETVAFVDEPLDLWQKYDLLKFMYNGLEANNNNQPLGDEALDPCSFQTVALATRTASLHKVLMDPKVRVVICERSPEADKYVFATTTLKTTAQRNAYELVYDKVLSMLPPTKTHHFVLQLDPSVAKKRILSRNRTEELNISLEYLETLDQGHHTLMDSTLYASYMFEANVEPQQLTCNLIERIDFLKNGWKA